MHLPTHANPPTSSSTRMSSSVARAMTIRRRGFIGGAGAGLALLELSVGVGGDAGGVGQRFLAEAPGDAGALQLHTQLAGDEPPLLVTWLVEEEAIGRGPLLIALEGVLEERRQQSRTKSVPPSSPSGIACNHCQSPNCIGVSQALTIMRRMPARVKETASRAALVLRMRW